MCCRWDTPHTSFQKHYRTPSSSRLTGPGLYPDSLSRTIRTINAKYTSLLNHESQCGLCCPCHTKTASHRARSPGTRSSSCLRWHHQAFRQLFTSNVTADLHRLLKWFFLKIPNYYVVFRLVYCFHRFQFWSKKLKTNGKWHLSSGEFYHFQNLLKYIILFDLHSNPEREAQQVVIWFCRWGNWGAGVICCRGWPRTEESQAFEFLGQCTLHAASEQNHFHLLHFKT